MTCGPEEFDDGAETLAEAAARIAAEVPDSEWAKLPEDLSAQVDYYLYGAPKR